MNWLLETPDGIEPLGAGREGEPVIAVIPGDDVALHRLLLVETSAARRLEEARMRAVDLAAGPAEELHVAVGEAEADGGSWIALIDRAAMASHVDAFTAAGAAPRHMVPAALLLPADGGARLGELMLIRTAEIAGAVEPGLAAHLAPDAHRSAGSFRFLPEADTPVPLDLMQGAFAPRRRWWKERRFRIASAALSLLALVLALAPFAIGRARSAAAIAGFDRATVEIAQQALGPAAPAEAGPASAALAAARNRAEGAAVGARLSMLAREVEMLPGARLGGIGLKGDAMRVELGGPAEAINGIAPRIAAGPFTAERQGTEMLLGERRAGVLKSGSPYSEAMLRFVAARADAAIVAAHRARPKAPSPAALAERIRAMLAANGLSDATVAETGGGVAVNIPAARAPVLLPLLADIETAGAHFTALDLRPQDDKTLGASFGARP